MCFQERQENTTPYFYIKNIQKTTEYNRSLYYMLLKTYFMDRYNSVNLNNESSTYYLILAGVLRAMYTGYSCIFVHR